MERLLEAVFKTRLTPNYGVVPNFEMLTYSRVRSAFKIRYALSLGVIQVLNTASQWFLPGGLMRAFQAPVRNVSPRNDALSLDVIQALNTASQSVLPAALMLALHSLAR